MNSVLIGGIIKTNFVFYQETENEQFYMFMVAVERKNGKEDTIPVIISSKLMETVENRVGKNVLINGRLKSFDRNEQNKTDLTLYVEPIEIDCPVENRMVNKINIIGTVCKEPTVRHTPNGETVSSVLLAVNRSDGGKEYIQCVAWDENARKIANKKIGSEAYITGRIQTRQYYKDDHRKTAYEVSIKGMP